MLPLTPLRILGWLMLAVALSALACEAAGDMTLWPRSARFRAAASALWLVALYVAGLLWAWG